MKDPLRLVLILAFGVAIGAITVLIVPRPKPLPERIDWQVADALPADTAYLENYWVVGSGVKGDRTRDCRKVSELVREMHNSGYSPILISARGDIIFRRVRTELSEPCFVYITSGIKEDSKLGQEMRRADTAKPPAK